MIDYYPAMIPGEYYHVFNRGNNRDNILYKPGNGTYFLGKYNKYMSPILETYAYCLLPNHFHLLVRVKTLEEILSGASSADLPGFQNLVDLAARKDEAATSKCISEMVSEQFRLLFMSYAKAINKQEKRVGSLFQKNFKRLNIKSEEHRKVLILYIHANPQLHRLHDNFRTWPNSSYAAMLSNSPTKVCRVEVLEWFGGTEQFIIRHNQYIDWKTAVEWMIED